MSYVLILKTVLSKIVEFASTWVGALILGLSIGALWAHLSTAASWRETYNAREQQIDAETRAEQTRQLDAADAARVVAESTIKALRAEKADIEKRLAENDAHSHRNDARACFDADGMRRLNKVR
jgi:hypothetical protein